MSKYIIDVPDEIEWGVVTCRTEGGFFTRDFDSLEELNSDYINEHFGELQETAYQRGLEEGKKATWELVAEASNAEYQKGLNDAWECAKKMTWTAKKQDDEIKVGDIVERYINGKLDSTGIYLGEAGGYWNCLFWTGTVFGTFAYPKNQFKKTGRHVDITDMLKGALE